MEHLRILNGECPLNAKQLLGVDMLPDIFGYKEELRAGVIHYMGDILGAYVPLTMDDCREIYEIACRQA